MMRKEALRRGMASAPRMAVPERRSSLQTGSSRASTSPAPCKILDFYHGMEHVGNLVNALEAKDSPAAQKQVQPMEKKRLFKGCCWEIHRQATARLPTPARGARPPRAKSPTWNSTSSELQYGTFASRGTSLARSHRGPVASPWSGSAANSQECIGPSPVWTTSWNCRCLLASGALWDQFWQNRQETKRTPLAIAA